MYFKLGTNYEYQGIIMFMSIGTHKWRFVYRGVTYRITKMGIMKYNSDYTAKTPFWKVNTVLTQESSDIIGDILGRVCMAVQNYKSMVKLGKADLYKDCLRDNIRDRLPELCERLRVYPPGNYQSVQYTICQRALRTEINVGDDVYDPDLQIIIMSNSVSYDHPIERRRRSDNDYGFYSINMNSPPISPHKYKQWLVRLEHIALIAAQCDVVMRPCGEI